MNLDWASVADELEHFDAARGAWPLDKLSALALDTLHGSMWGLNHRYRTVEECLREDWPNMMQYSQERVHAAMELGPMDFRPRDDAGRCGVGLGTYGWKYDPAVIHAAVAMDVAVIDTAEGYGYGRVETELGVALRGRDFNRVATKISRNHMTPRALPKAAERSAQKLGRPVHLQLHYPHADMRDETLAGMLVSLRRRGVILSVGLGNCSVDMIETMQHVLSAYSGDVIRSVQVRYNLADRRVEGCLLPYCTARGIVMLAYSPLGQSPTALLTDTLNRIAAEKHASPFQVALAWLLSHPGVIPIPRTNNPAHLRANMGAERMRLSPEECCRLEAAYSACRRV